MLGDQWCKHVARQSGQKAHHSIDLHLPPRGPFWTPIGGPFWTPFDTQVAAQNAGIAAQRVGILVDSTNRLVNEQGKPAAEDLRKAIALVQRAADNLGTHINVSLEPVES